MAEVVAVPLCGGRLFRDGGLVWEIHYLWKNIFGKTENHIPLPRREQRRATRRQ